MGNSVSVDNSDKPSHVKITRAFSEVIPHSGKKIILPPTSSTPPAGSSGSLQCPPFHQHCHRKGSINRNLKVCTTMSADNNKPSLRESRGCQQLTVSVTNSQVIPPASCAEGGFDEICPDSTSSSTGSAALSDLPTSSLASPLADLVSPTSTMTAATTPLPTLQLCSVLGTLASSPTRLQSLPLPSFEEISSLPIKHETKIHTLSPANAVHQPSKFCKSPATTKEEAQIPHSLGVINLAERLRCSYPSNDTTTATTTTTTLGNPLAGAEGSIYSQLGHNSESDNSNNYSTRTLSGLCSRSIPTPPTSKSSTATTSVEDRYWQAENMVSLIDQMQQTPTKLTLSAAATVFSEASPKQLPSSRAESTIPAALCDTQLSEMGSVHSNSSNDSFCRGVKTRIESSFIKHLCNDFRTRDQDRPEFTASSSLQSLIEDEDEHQQGGIASGGK